MEDRSGRSRALTDSDLLESADCSPASPGRGLVEPEAAEQRGAETPFFPATPLLEPAGDPGSPSSVTNERGECVNLEATMEVKAVLGMNKAAKPFTPACMQVAATQLDDAPQDQQQQEQTLQLQQQQDPEQLKSLWVFVPYEDTMDCYAYDDANPIDCYGWQGMGWGEANAWQPATPSTASRDSISAAGSSSGDVTESSPSAETRTTVMLRNLPNTLSRDVLLGVLDRMGFLGQYDLAYIPVDFSTGTGLGYAFINMTSPAIVTRLWEAFDGFVQWSADNDKVCSVSWSDPHQGLAAHVERYQNSPVMHPEVPDEWKPALFMQGVRVDFPPPTKKLKAPKVRSKKARSP